MNPNEESGHEKFTKVMQGLRDMGMSPEQMHEAIKNHPPDELREIIKKNSSSQKAPLDLGSVLDPFQMRDRLRSSMYTPGGLNSRFHIELRRYSATVHGPQGMRPITQHVIMMMQPASM